MAALVNDKAAEGYALRSGSGIATQLSGPKYAWNWKKETNLDTGELRAQCQKDTT